MKLTIRKILNDVNSLAAIAQKQLPIKVSYAIAKNIKKLESELNIYYKEREKLIDKYCIKDDEGKNIIDENNNLKIANEHLEVWNKEINELMDIEVDIDIHKFNLDSLMCGNYDMTPAELMIIDYMIEE